MDQAVELKSDGSKFRPSSTWLLMIGLAALVIPTVIMFGRQVWSREVGAHGPIVVATGAWLIWRQRADFAQTGRIIPAVVWLSLPVSLAIYVFGRAYSFLSLEGAGLYLTFLSILYSRVGLAPMMRNWFPLFYLGFLVPPPAWLIDQMTIPLKQFVATVSAGGLHAVGFPVERDGVSLIVAQYRLLVEDACSGMNSLVGLTAISLFYIYLLRRASWKYSLVMVCMTIPIAIVANIVRILILVLLTYFFGDAIAQGFLHETAGMLLFATALLLVFLLDNSLAKIWPHDKPVAQ